MEGRRPGSHKEGKRRRQAEGRWRARGIRARPPLWRNICTHLLSGSPSPTPVDVCELPKERGPCRGAFPRWHYNTNTGQCEQFIYGGCRGNANRFDTQAACDSRCGVLHGVPFRVVACARYRGMALRLS